MRTIIAVVALSAWPALAHAEDAALTVGKCVEVFNGLNALDRGFDRVVKDDKGEHVIQTPFKLGDVRYTLATTLAMLRPIVDAADKARMGIIAEVGGGKPVGANTPEATKATAEYQKVIDKLCGVTLPRVSRKDLKLSDDNPIPISVLSLIGPMLTAE